MKSMDEAKGKERNKYVNGRYERSRVYRDRNELKGKGETKGKERYIQKIG